MTVPIPSFTPNPGEAPGDFLVRIVRSFVGCSLHARRDELGALVARGVDDPERVVTISTNCAMFALGVLAAAGCPHPLLKKPYQNGMAFAWLVQIGNDLGAWRTPGTGATPPPGAAIWYEIPGTNDDHVEWMLAEPDEHGGGGRPDNAITAGHGDVHESWSRPIHRWLDPEALDLPETNAPDHGQPVDEATADTIPIPQDAVRDTQPPPTDPDATHRPS